MDNFAQSIYDKISFIFDEFVLLPTYFNVEDRKKYIFVAIPRKQENLEKLKNVFHNIESELEVNDVKKVNDGHEFYVKDNKVVILYAKNKESFDFFCDVSSYGINIILGKMVKPLGLKLTQNELIYEEKLGIENHQSKVGDFLITSDSKKLMELLGLDYDIFKKGFKYKEEMFDFVISSPYFSANKFMHPKKKSKSNIFLSFQDYLIMNNLEDSSYDNLSFEIVDEFFPEIDFYGEISKLKEKEIKKREAIKKFNGRTILEYYPNFDKKKIGTSIGYFKYSFKGVDRFKNFLLENTTEQIMNKFEEVVKF